MSPDNVLFIDKLSTADAETISDTSNEHVRQTDHLMNSQHVSSCAKFRLTHCPPLLLWALPSFPTCHMFLIITEHHLSVCHKNTSYPISWKTVAKQC